MTTNSIELRVNRTYPNFNDIQPNVTVVGTTSTCVECSGFFKDGEPFTFLFLKSELDLERKSRNGATIRIYNILDDSTLLEHTFGSEEEAEAWYAYISP